MTSENEPKLLYFFDLVLSKLSQSLKNNTQNIKAAHKNENVPLSKKLIFMHFHI